MKRLIAQIVFGFGISFQLYAQCTPCNDPAPALNIDFNSAALNIMKGANLEFNFQTISDYRDGITMNDATVLGVSICDCVSEGGGSPDPYPGSTITGYSIYFDSDDAQFNGMSGATLPLCILEASASVHQGYTVNNITTSGIRRPLGAYPTGEGAIFQEDSNPATISSRDWSTDQISIDYFMGVAPANGGCGATYPLLSATGLTPDAYFVTISFTLVPECTNCGVGFTEY